METKTNPDTQNTGKEQETAAMPEQDKSVNYECEFLEDMLDYEFDEDFELEEYLASRRREIHFGQSFLFYSLLERSGLLALLNTIDIDQQDRDTFLSLLFYIALTPYISGIKSWWKEDLASCLFPKANLKAENLARLFHRLSNKEVQMKFFKNWIQWIQHFYPEEKVRLIEGEIENHEHPKRNQYFESYVTVEDWQPVSTQMILAIGEKSGLPYYYALCDQEEEDFSSKEYRQILDDLKTLSIPISYAVFDMVGSDPSIFDVFFDQNHKPYFDFTIQLTGKHPYFIKKLAEYKEELEKEENLVEDQQGLYQSASFSASFDQKEKNQLRCTLVVNKTVLDRKADQNELALSEEKPDWLDILEEADYEGAGAFFTSKKRPVKTIFNRYKQRKYLSQLYFIQDVFSKLNSTEFDPVLVFLSVIAGGLWAYMAQMFKQAGMRLEKRLPDPEDLMARVDGNRLKTSALLPHQKEVFEKLDLNYPRTVQLDNLSRLSFSAKRKTKPSGSRKGKQ